jgi:hypothetical protein
VQIPQRSPDGESWVTAIQKRATTVGTVGNPRHHSPTPAAPLLSSILGTASAEAVRAADSPTERNESMLWTIAVILIVLWLLGLLTSYSMGGLIHLLIVIAIILVVWQFIQGRR